jgi:hypothetical protein
MKLRIVHAVEFARFASTVWAVSFPLLGGSLAGAQIVHATGPLPSFEVATIKPRGKCRESNPRLLGRLRLLLRRIGGEKGAARLLTVSRLER